MRALTKVTCFLALLGSVAVLHAQSGTAETTTAPAPTAPTNTMTVAEMQAGMSKFDVQMQSDYRDMLHFQERARKAKDVIKLNCVNERLVEVKAQLNNGDNTKAQLNVALTKSDGERFTLYQDLSVTANRVNQLRTQAEACVGVPDLQQNESGVVVERPETPDDPTKGNPFGLDSVTDVEAPGYASPFN